MTKLTNHFDQLRGANVRISSEVSKFSHFNWKEVNFHDLKLFYFDYHNQPRLLTSNSFIAIHFRCGDNIQHLDYGISSLSMYNDLIQKSLNQNINHVIIYTDARRSYNGSHAKCKFCFLKLTYSIVHYDDRSYRSNMLEARW